MYTLKTLMNSNPTPKSTAPGTSAGQVVSRRGSCSRNDQPGAAHEHEIDGQRRDAAEPVGSANPADGLGGGKLERERPEQHADSFRRRAHAACRALPHESVHLRQRAVQRRGRIEHSGNHQDEDEPACATRGRRCHLACDQAAEAGLFGDLDRTLVGRVRIEPETGHEQQRRRQQQDEEPVRKRAGEQSAPDIRVALDDRKPHVDRRMSDAGGMDVLAKDASSLHPASELPCGGRLDLELRHLSVRSRSRQGDPRPRRLRPARRQPSGRSRRRPS